jgi:hypothetical protein
LISSPDGIVQKRKAIMKQWAKREEHIERMMGATVDKGRLFSWEVKKILALLLEFAREFQ